MSGATIVGNLDVAELVFYIFFVFFLGLVIYLRREDRREGYPLETDQGRLLPNDGLLQTALPKSFTLPHGLGKVSPPATKEREPVDITTARRTAKWPGSPIYPVGDPLVSRVGPAAYAQRADRPDLDMEGHPRIVPLSSAGGFFLAARDPDPRGMKIAGTDGVIAGTVDELWVDKADHMVRYLSVALSGGGRATVPMMMCRIDKARKAVICDAVTGSQFAGAPVPASPGQLTLLEEEKIVGYFGGGYLYATPARAEPLV